MASIIKANINLNDIPKDKIYVGKKGKYLPITITINDELDQFGNQGPVVVEQTPDVLRHQTFLAFVARNCSDIFCACARRMRQLSTPNRNEAGPAL